jgi:hypothetical protein
MPVTKTTKDVTGTSPWKRSYGNMPIGYTGKTTLKKEQCDMMNEIQNTGTNRYGHC